MNRDILMFTILGLLFVDVHATSLPFFREKVNVTCPEGESICNEDHCYSPSTHECLTYSDGSGGTVCPRGDTHCGGVCLTPGQGYVCMTGDSDYEVICREGQRVCNIGDCYDPEEQDCVEGHTVCPKGEVLCGHGSGSCYKAEGGMQCLQGDFNSYLCNVGERLCRGNICYDPRHEICLKKERRVCMLGDYSCIHLYNSL